MNRTIVFIKFFLFLQVVVFAQTPSNDSHWQLKWEDQFNSFNTNRWVKAHNGIHTDDTKEPQLYLADQVWVSNGNLIIKLDNTPVYCDTSKHEGPCPPCIAGKKYDYRSGCIHLENPYNTQFGYIEARIKFPFRKDGSKSWGFWPAFWTYLGGNLPAPETNHAEIDICEIFSGRHSEPNTILTCIHRGYPTSTPPINDANKGISHVFSNFSYTDWHTYAVEWNADRIIWYVDGKAIRSYNSHEIVDPVRLILNLAIQPEKKYYPPTEYPWLATMEVDYVKVHQLKCDKNTVVNEISNFNIFNYAVKKSISLSNATTIPSGSNISLRATDFIELKAGFEVQTGRELYLDVTPCTEPDCCLDYLTDQTITSNTTVTGCDMLLVQDVEISNSAQVVITAGEEMSIKPGFHAAAGTNVKIGIAP